MKDRTVQTHDNDYPAKQAPLFPKNTATPTVQVSPEYIEHLCFYIWDQIDNKLETLDKASGGTMWNKDTYFRKLKEHMSKCIKEKVGGFPTKTSQLQKLMSTKSLDNAGRRFKMVGESPTMPRDGLSMPREGPHFRISN